MKDRLYLYFYNIAKSPVIKPLAIKYYEFAIKVLKFFLKKNDFIQSVYLKGSFGKKYFVPFISDLDFFIIGEVTPTHRRQLERLFMSLNIFFPMISDFDFHTDKEAEILSKHAGLKFFDTSSWKLVLGKNFQFSYLYHSRRFQLEVLYEIYFQLEWVFKNLKLRRNKEKYRTNVLRRQYYKIIDYTNYFYQHDLIKKERTQVQESDQWYDLTNEEIVFLFNDLLMKNLRINELLTVYRKELYDISISSILEEEYYKKNLVLIDEKQKFKFEGHLHYFTRELFELFLLTGCIDTYFIFDWIKKSNEHISKYFIESMYYAKLIEGKNNRKHNEHYVRDNWDYIIKKIEDCDEFSILGENFSFNSFGADLVSFTSFNPTPKEEIVLSGIINEFIRIETNFKLVLIVFKETHTRKYISAENDKVNIIYLTVPQISSYLQNDSLHLRKLALEWCVGANIVLFSDLTLKLDGNWLKCIEKEFDENPDLDFLIPYTSVQYKNTKLISLLNENDEPFSYQLSSREDKFIWAAKKTKWDDLGYLVDFNYGIYNNELFYYTITGDLPEIEDEKRILNQSVKDAFIKNQNIKSLTYLLECNQELNKVLQKNQLTLSSVFFDYLRGQFKRGYLGLWRLDSDQYYQKIKQFIIKSSMLDGYVLRENIKIFESMKIANIGSKFTLNNPNESMNNIVGHDGGYGFEFKKSNLHYVIFIGGITPGFKFFDINLKYNLPDDYIYEDYLLQLAFDSEYGMGKESGLISIKPNGVSEKEVTVWLENITNEKIRQIIRLDEHITYLEFKFLGHLRSDCVYHFKIDQLERAKKFEFEEYYRKVRPDISFSHRCSLFYFHKGYFRLDVILKREANFRLIVWDDTREILKKVGPDKDSEVTFFSFTLPVNIDGPLYLETRGITTDDIRYIDVYRSLPIEGEIKPSDKFAH